MAWWDTGMGFSGFSGGYREPAPRRLTREELLGLATFRPTPRPAPITDLRDLEGDDRRRAQQESVFAGLASLGAAMSSGRYDRLGAGLGDVQAAQQGVLADVNARQDAAWQEGEQRRAVEYEEAERQQKASALYGMYQKVIAGEPEGAFTVRAETAARTGSMAELAGMLQEKPKRAAARAKGYNPDAWDVNSRLEEELKAEIKRAQAQKDWEEGEKARLEEKARMEREAEVEKERALREESLGRYEPPDPPQYEPLSRIAARTELVESIQAKHRKEPEAQRSRVQILPGDPTSGTPPSRVFVETGTRYPIEEPRAIEQRLVDIQSVVGKLPPAMLAQAEADLRAGKPPRQIVAEIREAMGQRR